MTKQLRVLIAEDSEADCLLLMRELQRGGYDPVFSRVETAVEFKRALADESWDIVLADYSLPQFSAPAALLLLKETGLDLPCIVVSGSVGEDTAVAVLKAGANDYIMKGNPNRLGPAIGRELRDAAARVARREGEQARARLAAIVAATTDLVATADLEGRIQYLNRAGREMLGLGEDEDVSKIKLFDCHPLWAREIALCEAIPGALKSGVWSGESAVISRGGVEIPVSEVLIANHSTEGTIEFLSMIARDITEQKAYGEAIKKSERQYRDLFENANDIIYTLDTEG